MSNVSSIEMILPEGLLNYFEVTQIIKEAENFKIYLSEKNIPPKEYVSDKLTSKGFFDEITVQDFPIRGHQVYLHITRRRWLNEDTRKIVFRDWNLVADGTRVTQEFASFLKEINRFQA